MLIYDIALLLDLIGNSEGTKLLILTVFFFCLVFTAPAKWRVELRAKIGHYRNRCLVLWFCLKVETIGDAYMVVAGVPEFVDDHAARIVDMGLDMIQETNNVLNPISSKPIQVCRQSRGPDNGYGTEHDPGKKQSTQSNNSIVQNHPRM